MNKQKIKNLSKKLLRESTLVWDVLSEKEKKETFKICDEYKNFLDSAKTERKACSFILNKAKKEGFSRAERRVVKYFEAVRLKRLQPPILYLDA